jgi:hypothetical protein
MIEKLCWVWTSRVSSILLGLELITSMREKRERERELRSKYVVNMLQKKKKKQLQHETYSTVVE